MQEIVLEMTEPFIQRDYGLDYRRCDFCDYWAVQDIWNGKMDESQWRQFYWMPEDGLSVCESCIPDIESPEAPHADTL